METNESCHAYLIKSIGENVVNMTKDPWKKNNLQPWVTEMTNAVLAIDYIGLEDDNEDIILRCYAHMFLSLEADDDLPSELIMRHMSDRFNPVEL